MLKKIINLLVIFIFVNSIITPQELRLPAFLHHSGNINNPYAIYDKYSKNISLIDYHTYNDTNVYGNKWTINSTIKKQTKLKDSKLIETEDHYILIGRNDFWVNADDAYIKNSSLLPSELVFNQIKQDSEWVPTWYNDVLKCEGKEFEAIVYKHAYYLENKWIGDAECWWYEDSLFSYPCVFRFQNTYFSMTIDGWGVQNFIVKKITKEKDAYFITCSAQGFSYDDYAGNTDYLEKFPKVSDEDDFTLRLEFRNNLIYLYNNESNQLIVELMHVTSDWIDKLQTYFNTGNNSFFSERREDELINTINSNHPMTVRENLKLRSGEATSTQVLAVMSARTRVKVLAPGREDTIDGIASSWVQVEVLDGAKDKDGNAVEAGTIGWLFGGYLSEAESAESESPNEEASAAKKSSALPIVPIAAGGAAFAILFAMIILAVKKRKASKD